MTALWRGARAIGAIKDDLERERAEQAGFKVVVDTSKENVTEAVMTIIDGSGAGLVFDTVSGTIFESSIKVPN